MHSCTHARTHPRTERERERERAVGEKDRHTYIQTETDPQRQRE